MAGYPNFGFAMELLTTL